MDVDIEELFENLIKKYREQEAAFEELKLMLEDDEELKKSYEEWCAAMACSEKKGFGIFYQEYMERDDSIWDSIFPNKEEYDGYDN
ncbi:hypothetical protein [Coprobacter sp.]